MDKQRMTPDEVSDESEDTSAAAREDKSPPSGGRAGKIQVPAAAREDKSPPSGGR